MNLTSNKSLNVLHYRLYVCSEPFKMATSGDQDTPPYVGEDAAVGGKLPAMCDPCGRRKRTTPATVLCSTCDTHLCRECCQMHQIYVPGEHVFSSIQDDKKGYAINNMQGQDRCAEHDRVFVYICKEHDCLCCEDCQFYKHKKCDKIHKIIEMTGGVDVSLSDSKTELQGIILSGGDIIESCSVTLEEIEVRRNKIIREINKKKMDMLRRFDEAVSCVEGELDTLDASDTQRILGVKHETETLQTNVQELLSLNEVVNENGTGAEKFILNFLCKQKLHQVVETYTEVAKNVNTVNMQLEWNEHILNGMNTVSPIAVLKTCHPFLSINECDQTKMSQPVDVDLDSISNESVTDLNIDRANSRDAHASQDTEIKATGILVVKPTNTGLQFDEIKPRPIRLTLVASLDLVKTGGETRFPLVTGMCFLADGRIVAVDNRNKMCFVMNASLQRQGIGIQLQLHPRDVTSMQGNTLAVSHR